MDPNVSISQGNDDAAMTNNVHSCMCATGDLEHVRYEYCHFPTDRISQVVTARAPICYNIPILAHSTRQDADGELPGGMLCLCVKLDHEAHAIKNTENEHNVTVSSLDVDCSEDDLRDDAMSAKRYVVCERGDSDVYR